MQKDEQNEVSPHKRCTQSKCMFKNALALIMHHGDVGPNSIKKKKKLVFWGWLVVKPVYGAYFFWKSHSSLLHPSKIPKQRIHTNAKIFHI